MDGVGRERMSTGDEILQNVSGVCQRVKQRLVCFVEGEVPDDLDSLIFLVERLNRFLLALDLTSAEISDCCSGVESSSRNRSK